MNEEETDDFNRDEDCNPCTVGDASADADDDGFFNDEACNVVDERPSDDACPGFDPARPTLRIVSDTLVCGTDCDDTAPGVFPTAPEACDDADNDCDGATDEDGTSSWYPDVDGDNHGSSTAAPLVACGTPSGYAVSNDDCNDGNPNIYGGSPGATEICNGVDDNCDLVTDEGDPGSGASCNPAGRPGAPCAGRVHCVGGVPSCVQNDASYPRTEECNNIDDDCNGTVDLFDGTCTNPCGSGYGTGTATCTEGRWGACSNRSATRGCTAGCGTGVEACTEGVWRGCGSISGPDGSCSLCDAGWPGTMTCRSDGSWSACDPREYTLSGDPGCPSSYMFYHDAGYSTGCAWYVPDSVDDYRTVLGIGPWMPYGVYRITVTGTALDSGAFGVWVDWNGTSTAFTNRRLGSSWTLQGEFTLGGACGDAGWSSWPTIVYRGGYWAGWMRISGVTIERLRDG